MFAPVASNPTELSERSEAKFTGRIESPAGGGI